MGTLVVVGAICTHFFMIAGKEVPDVVRYLPDRVFGWLRIRLEGMPKESYTALISDLVVAAGFVLAWVPLVQAWRTGARLRRERRADRDKLTRDTEAMRRKYGRDLREERKKFYEGLGMEVQEVETPGVDDLKWMLKHYVPAKRIKVFAGSFDWIPLNEELRDVIVSMAEQEEITLYSYWDEQKVRGALGGAVSSDGGSLFEALKARFRFLSAVKIICSLTEEAGSDKKFLYRSPSESKPFNVCFHSDHPHSRLLVDIVGQFCRARDWGVKLGQSSPVDQDARPGSPPERFEV